jgi:tRNA A-37 threonylcarbamoyl transferase component Bud32/tetratricopeptide (TPR) repeat protein
MELRVFPPDQTAELSTPAGRKPPRADVAAAAADSIADGRSEHRPPSKVGVWEEGSVINDRYTLERRLGGGSMGVVFLANDRLLKKQVALKVLRSDLAKSRATVRRFLREVALAHSVTHPNVVRIYDTGEADGLPYFSMEHLQGQTLDELIEAGRQREGDGDPPMMLREIREISHEILSGLAAAHEVGIVHRDLKPANVMLTHRGAIVMDFGVAGFDQPTPGVRPNPAEARSLVRTEAGTIFGSPAYMAPELWEGAGATVQSDLYSFGVMLYQMLSGRLPIEAPNAKAFLIKLKEEKPTPIRQLRKDTPWNLALLVSRCMATDPERRPVSAHAAANLVAPFSGRWTWMLGGLLVVLLGGIIGFWLNLGRLSPAEKMGLPDAVAVADLDAFVRSFDVGDYEAAQRQISRLELRAPDSAAVVYWRATLEHSLGNDPERWNRCRAAGYENETDGSQWQGSESWRALATGACASSYSLSPEQRNLLDSSMSSALPDAWLPIVVSESLVPRIEASRALGVSLSKEADDVLARLDEGDAFEDGPVLAIRWQLARFDLRVARGQFDEARNLLDDLLTQYPDAPIVLARAAHFYALTGELERATEWAVQVESYDPRPRVRLLLDAGRLDDAAALMDTYALQAGERPLQQQLLDMWCAYAYRFEIFPAPVRCGSIGPGLAHNLWISAHADVADSRAMSALEREIIQQQAALNRSECYSQGHNQSIVTHADAPFETYLRQLDIYTALCAANGGDSSALQLARALADDLVAVAPGDPWALLVDAQVDDDMLAHAVATEKRRLVVERWREADDDLPLVLTVRRLVGEPTPEPLPPESLPPPPSAPASEPILMTPADGELDAGASDFGQGQDGAAP